MNKKLLSLSLMTLLGGTLSASAGWVEVFRDDFNSTTLNSSVWAYNVPYYNSNGSFGGYSEYRGKAKFLPANIRMSGSTLGIISKRENVGSGQWYRAYTTGWVTTANKRSWKYGKFQASAKWSVTRGCDAGWWLFKAGYGWPPEIDIVEAPGYHPGKNQVNVHWRENNQNKNSWKYITVPNMSTTYNRYEMEWNSSVVIFRLNGGEHHRVYHPPVDNMFMNFATEIDGGPGDTFFGDPAAGTYPVTSYIDWVTIQQWR